MRTAFVLSGGANLGAVQVGMLRALAEHGAVPDLLVGTSVGAFNAAYIANRGMDHFVLEDLAEIWRGLHSWKLFPPNPVRIVSALAGHETALVGDHGLRTLLREHLDFERLEETRTPLTVVATDLLTGDEVALSSGPALEAILASAAIPALLPAVDWDGKLLVDGGVSDNTPISDAVEAGAEVIYVLPCGYPCAATTPPTTVGATLMHTMALLVHRRLVRDIREYTSDAELIVLPPPCPIDIGALDFSQADELITRGYSAAAEFLAIDGGRRTEPAAHVDVHAH